MSLLHIPSENKKPSKKDGPLEKETRRFNKLVKEIEELQKESEQHKQEDELYHQLFLQKVHPVLIEVANAQVSFIDKLEEIFYSEKSSKNTERQFLEFAIPVLQDASIYLDTAKDKLQNYIVWQSSLQTNKERHPALNETAAEEEEIYSKQEKEKSSDDENYESVPDLDKKSVMELYKELAKQVHPDLEQVEEIKHVKQQLMAELSEARDREDIYAMLVIRQKAAGINNDEADQSPYTLQLLKKYNASLKKKLEQIKREINQSVFGSFYSKEDFFAHGKKKQPVEMRIKQQLKDLKELYENLQHNTRIIRNGNQLRDLVNVS